MHRTDYNMRASPFACACNVVLLRALFFAKRTCSIRTNPIVAGTNLAREKLGGTPPKQIDAKSTLPNRRGYLAQQFGQPCTPPQTQRTQICTPPMKSTQSPHRQSQSWRAKTSTAVHHNKSTPTSHSQNNSPAVPLAVRSSGPPPILALPLPVPSCHICVSRIVYAPIKGGCTAPITICACYVVFLRALFFAGPTCDFHDVSPSFRAFTV